MRITSSLVVLRWVRSWSQRLWCRGRHLSRLTHRPGDWGPGYAVSWDSYICILGKEPIVLPGCLDCWQLIGTISPGFVQNNNITSRLLPPFNFYTLPPAYNRKICVIMNLYLFYYHQEPQYMLLFVLFILPLIIALIVTVPLLPRRPHCFHTEKHSWILSFNETSWFAGLQVGWFPYTWNSSVLLNFDSLS